ncbi:DUF128 domain-containing protein [bacterium]|nr:DUF128 domain-containing protein [bacterium]
MAILRALNDADKALGASRLARDLETMGIDVSQRTVRYHLAELDEKGFTRSSGKRGREITSLGEQELAKASVVEKVGFVASRIDELTYQMTFQLRRRTGNIVLNMSTVPADRAVEAAGIMLDVFRTNLSMGAYVVVGRPGEQLKRLHVPADQCAIGTVCSVTLNGVLLSAGIPTTSRFGGLLEIRDRQPVRFTQMIDYAGSSLDPIEIFIRGHMTSVGEAARTGSGIVGASFREVPAASVAQVRKLGVKLEQIGLGGLLVLGKPNRPLLEVPVSQGRAGLVVVGGLNPIAAVEEAGIPTHSKALTELWDFGELASFEQLPSLVAGATTLQGSTL